MPTYYYAVEAATGQTLYGPESQADIVSGLSPSQVCAPSDHPVDKRREYWNGSAFVERTANQIAAYDAAQPLLLDPVLISERLTDAEAAWFAAHEPRLMLKLTTRTVLNLHDPALQQELATLRAAVVPSLYPDAATAATRFAVILAVP